MTTGKKPFPIKLIVGLIGCAILFAYIGYRVMSALNALP
jgi:hypothetical protein